MVTVSVIIPAYEMHGFGNAFLNQALASLAMQSHLPLEVLVGDQSADGALRPTCEAWSGRLQVKWLDTSHCRGSPSANLNALAGWARGDVVKILFQDDLMATSDALARLSAAFAREPGRGWLVSAIEHTFDAMVAHRPFAPVLQGRLRYGINTFGPPSAVTVRRGRYLPFDPALSWMMDVEWYDRMMRAFGAPLLLTEVGVVSRQWGRQNTHELADARKRVEEARTLRSPAARDFEPTALMAAHSEIVGSLVRVGRIADMKSRTIGMRREAMNCVAKVAPIDLQTLSYIFDTRLQVKDAEWRRAVALLISYHTAEPIARRAIATLLASDPSELAELVGFRASLANYGATALYPMRLLPLYGQHDAGADFEIKRLRQALKSAMITTGRAFRAKLEDVVQIVAGCITRASALARANGISGRPVIIAAPGWPDYVASGPTANSGGECGRAGVVIALHGNPAVRRSFQTKARAACANGGYVIALDLAAAPLAAPERLALPDGESAMVTVEHVLH